MKFWQAIGAPSPDAAYSHLCAVIHDKYPECACAIYARGLRYLVEVELGHD